MRESILPRMHTDTQDTVLGGLLTHTKDRKMSLVLGEPGEVKTITVLDFCSKVPISSYYYRCSPNTTMNSLLVFIANAIGDRTAGNNEDIQSRIQEKLNYSNNCCFVFDEAEYLAYGNGNKIVVLRQIFDSTDVPIILCGTYVLKDLISGEKKKSISSTHNRPQIIRRLRKEEFDIIKEKEIFTYLSTLEVEYNVVFEAKVQNELVSCCRDRRNGGLGNFIEIIELLFSIVRPEWVDISYQIIERDHRVLHNHFEQFQSYTSLKPNKNDEETEEQKLINQQE